MLKVMFVSLAFLALDVCSPARAEQAASTPPLTVQSHHAAVDGFLSNSHLILGEREAILIDAQFSAEEGRKVATLIRASGKKLSTIVITHPHPDHYYGLEVLAATFREAVILGGPLTIREIKNSMKYWVGRGKVEDVLAETAVLEGDEGSFLLEQTALSYQVRQNVESIENTLVYIPALSLLFIGDLASNGVHLWLSEGRMDRWVAQLREIGRIGPISSVYPGHGPVGGPSLLDDAVKYILDFQRTVKNTENAGAVMEGMEALYPNYRMPQILFGSASAAMAP